MTMIKVGIFLLALALPCSAVAGRDYVPDSGWNDAWSAQFYEEWVGEQLRAMREPTLASASDLKGFRQRFRLVILPSFRPAYAYRIDERYDGRTSLRRVRLDGAGGYAPGRVEATSTRALTATEASEWTSVLGQAVLPELERTKPPELVREADGTEAIVVSADGTTFVFELLNAEGRNFVVRSCSVPELGLQSVVQSAARLAGDQDPSDE